MRAAGHELRAMNPEEESLYAEMRAAVRGDQERAAKRAQERAAQPDPTPEPRPAEPEEPEPVSGLRRFFGGHRDRPDV
jgi:hypothetical protein